MARIDFDCHECAVGFEFRSSNRWGVVRLRFCLRLQSSLDPFRELSQSSIGGLKSTQMADQKGEKRIKGKFSYIFLILCQCWERKTCRIKYLRMVAGVDLNHRPLGYEANPKNDSIIFQRLDDAGNDRKSLNRKSLKRPQSRVIGPQSDHDFLLLIAVLQRVVFCQSWLLRAVSLCL